MIRYKRKLPFRDWICGNVTPKDGPMASQQLLHVLIDFKTKKEIS